MTRVLDRRKAFELRKLGKSYSQIKSELGISKSTLSEWLRAYPLSKEQIDALRGKSEIRIEKYRETRRKTRESRLQAFYNEEKSKWLPFSSREFFLAGLFLYWGEGSKTLNGTVSVNNTDPSVLKFILHWMRESLHIPTERIKVYLHLYSDMDINGETRFWKEALHLPLKNFLRPYIKKSTRAAIDQKGFGHGTCGLRVESVLLKERILMAIKSIADYYDTMIKTDIITHKGA